MNTIQRTEFQPYEKYERVKPIKNIENHQLSNEPVSGISSYKADFPFNENNSFAIKVKRNPNESSYKIFFLKFSLSLLMSLF